MRRLYRSREGRVISGVAAGMGRYFGIDPVLVRLAWVAMVFAKGAGLLAYLIAAFIIPEEPAGGANREERVVTAGASDAAGTAATGAAAGTGAAGTRAAGGDGAVPSKTTVRRHRDHSTPLAGLFLVALGGYFLIREFVPWLSIERFWPLILIAGGLAVLFGGFGR